MLDELKSKLGFGGDAARGRSNDRYDDYDDYGDYEDDYSEYAEYADDYADDSGNDYDPYAPVTTRSARSNSTISNLVSINDVRAHARGEGSSSTASTSARRMTTAHTPYRGERTTVDSSLPPTMTPEGSAAVAAAASRPTRSEGLNSLFEPTASEAKPAGKHAATTPSSSHMGVTSGATSASAAGSLGAFTRQPASSSAAAAIGESTQRAASSAATASYDPQSAYAQAQGARYVAKRSCTVLKPASYGEVERIARALKGGDAVILALRNTPDSLSKRILDFSFGVSSALDAGVECIGDKVFAITKGDALTDAEKLALRNQGVL